MEKNNIEDFVYKDHGFYISVAGLSLISVSIYHTLDIGAAIFFIVGLVLCVLPVDIMLTLRKIKGDIKMTKAISFSKLTIIIIGMVLMITSLTDIMSVIDLITFSVGLALLLNSIIRTLVKK